MGFLAARSGLLRLAEALAFRGDLEVVSSTVRAVVATLKSGEKCGVEPELVGKGTSGLGTVRLPSLAAWCRGSLLDAPKMRAVERSGSLPGRPHVQQSSPGVGSAIGILCMWGAPPPPPPEESGESFGRCYSGSTPRDLAARGEDCEELKEFYPENLCAKTWKCQAACWVLETIAEGFP